MLKLSLLCAATSFCFLACSATSAMDGGSTTGSSSSSTGGTTGGSADAGSPCSPFGASCPSGQYCNYSVASCDGGGSVVVPGTCLIPVASGASCATTADCGANDVCGKGTSQGFACPELACALVDAGSCALPESLPSSLPHHCTSCAPGCMLAACPADSTGPDAGNCGAATCRVGQYCVPLCSDGGASGTCEAATPGSTCSKACIYADGGSSIGGC